MTIRNTTLTVAALMLVAAMLFVISIVFSIG